MKYFVDKRSRLGLASIPVRWRGVLVPTGISHGHRFHPPFAHHHAQHLIVSCIGQLFTLSFVNKRPLFVAVLVIFKQDLVRSIRSPSAHTRNSD